MSRLQDKVCIITGASSGIGRAIALAYAKEGGIIVSADLQPEPRGVGEGESTEPTHDMVKASGGKAIFVKTDVGKSAEVEAVVKAAVKEYGRLDVFVNNAGISIESRQAESKRTHETDDSTWDTTLDINARSVFFGCKYAAGQMLAQEPHASGDRGWIVNIASIAGLIGLPAAVSYCASKGAVVSLTRTVALEYAADRIHVNGICPGFIDSSLTRDMKVRNEQGITQASTMHPFGGGGLGIPDDVAGVAVFLASSDSKWVTGGMVTVDGGYTAH